MQMAALTMKVKLDAAWKVTQGCLTAKQSNRTFSIRCQMKVRDTVVDVLKTLFVCLITLCSHVQPLSHHVKYEYCHSNEAKRLRNSSAQGPHLHLGCSWVFWRFRPQPNVYAFGGVNDSQTARYKKKHFNWVELLGSELL